MKNVLRIILILLFSIPLAVNASARITEIMYDVPGTDTGREWVEIFNAGPETVDLSSWRLFESNINHKISAVGAAEIPSGGFAVIADSSDKFKIDNPSYSGLLFDSAFSLSNDGETIILRDSAGNDADTISYTASLGAAGDGNSLQRTQNGEWIAAFPTTGSMTTATKSSLPPIPNVQGDSVAGSSDVSAQTLQNFSNVSSHASQEVANVSPDEASLEVTSGRARLGFVGSPLVFEAKVKTGKSIPSDFALEDVWSFGDGLSAVGRSVNHTYFYPGDYVVVLNSRYADAQAVSRVAVHVVEPSPELVEAYKDHVTLLNPDTFELNLGGYTIIDGKNRFTFSPDTILSPKSSLKFSYPRASVLLDSTVSLLDPSGRERSSVQMTLAGEEPWVILPNGFDFEKLKQNFNNFIEKAKK